MCTLLGAETDQAGLSIQKFLDAAPALNAHQLVTVQGIVTLCYENGSVFIQDGTAGLLIETATNQTAAASEWIEATGRVFKGGYSPTLTAVAYHTLNRRGKVVPAQVNGADLYSGRYDMRLVQLEGILMSKPDYRAQDMYLSVQVGQHVISMFLDSAEPGNVLSLLKAGSRLGATGVCSLAPDQNRTLNPCL